MSSSVEGSRRNNKKGSGGFKKNGGRTTRNAGGKARNEKTKLSKQLSFALRHGADKLKLDINSDGFVLVEDLVSKPMFKGVTIEQLQDVVQTDAKGRYKLIQDEDSRKYKIRANQGHTLRSVKDEDLLREVQDAMEIPNCIHGTYVLAWEKIKTSGLNKMARNHIHMSISPPTSNATTQVQRGIRTNVQILIYIDVVKAMNDGIKFLQSDNGVILTDGIDGVLHPKYFQKVLHWPSQEAVAL